MVIDTSALIAILRDEPEAQSFRKSILAAPARRISAMTKLEASMVVIGRRDVAAIVELDRLLGELGIVVISFDDHHAEIARDAFARYGKARHPAGLNFGDCAAYALAVAEGEPLLFKGTDFHKTDVVVVQRD